MNHDSLKGKRALVTGGSRGIGAAIVKRLAREGADVALTYVSKPDEANKTAAAAKELGVQALAIQADSADAEAVVAAVERTVKEFGGIDILVNNAGIASDGADRHASASRISTAPSRSTCARCSSPPRRRSST